MGRPSSPVGVRASLIDTTLTVSWSSPVSDGGFALTGYTVRVSPGGASCTVGSSARSCEITGLSADTPYSVDVVVTNVRGDSSAVAAMTTSPPVTTAAPSMSLPVPVPLDGGALPELAPGASQVVESGVPVPVEMIVENQTDLVVRGDAFQMRFTGDCSPGCAITTGADGRQVLELQQNGLTRVEGSGFSPGTPVYVWLFSEPTLVGKLTADADGRFAASLSIAGVQPGPHTFQVNGTGLDGKTRSVNVGVVVSPTLLPSPLPTELPATGDQPDVAVLLLAGMFILSGVALVNRRRLSHLR